MPGIFDPGCIPITAKEGRFKRSILGAAVHFGSRSLFSRGEAFTASCDVEPAGCTVAWLLLLLSAIVHTMHWCATDESESDDDGPSTMYS